MYIREGRKDGGYPGSTAKTAKSAHTGAVRGTPAAIPASCHTATTATAICSQAATPSPLSYRLSLS